MSYDIICPYCFATMKDDEVLFRSERVDLRLESEILPAGYTDVQDVINRYQDSDKDKLLEELADWEFFSETEDKQYEKFWAKFGGATSEYNPADYLLGVEAFHRRVLDPSIPDHQHYLKQQEDGGYFIRDGDGMVTQLELKTGERCNRRVCPCCHNPLPDKYGKTPVKFIAVVGVAGAGKTVFLSQLLNDMENYAAKAGLSAIMDGPSIQAFIENNSIQAKKPMPGSTPVESFQQPLIYQMTKTIGKGRRQTETVVLYDVAGEVFISPQLVSHFAPFVQHASGVIVLIDPMQFPVIQVNSEDSRVMSRPTDVLQKIHNLITGEDIDEKCGKPMAICISKADIPELKSVLRLSSPELLDKLRTPVSGVPAGNGLYYPLFNGNDYRPIAEGLDIFVKNSYVALSTLMSNIYSHYGFFAFSALGCEVEVTTDERGNKLQCPVGPVLPRRVEEPLLWILSELGVIGQWSGDELPQPQEADSNVITGEFCPRCGSSEIEVIRPLFSRHNRRCRKCKLKWEQM